MARVLISSTHWVLPFVTCTPEQAALPRETDKGRLAPWQLFPVAALRPVFFRHLAVGLTGPIYLCLHLIPPLDRWSG